MIPLLFNTENVRAILEGRKNATRRVVKPQPRTGVTTLYRKEETNFWRTHGADCWFEFRAPCVPGDILWVRETWQAVYETEGCEDGQCTWKNIRELIPNFDNIQKVEAGMSSECSNSSMAQRMKYFVFKASEIQYADTQNGLVWRPSIHMPREAARIFLRVVKVGVERIQEIDDAGVMAEGLEIGCYFDELWDRTVKPADRPSYGWEANPWVWVIEFQQISKEEAEKCEKEKGSLLTAR